MKKKAIKVTLNEKWFKKLVHVYYEALLLYFSFTIIINYKRKEMNHSRLVD